METAQIKKSAHAQQPTFEDLLKTAEAAARAAGEIQRATFEKEAAVDAIHLRDIKLAVDRESENTITDLIEKRFPGHRILGEEGTDQGGSEPYLWIIDPLDGTVNYFHRLPQFCTCIACLKLQKDEPLPDTGEKLFDMGLIGVVYAPMFDEMYAGVSGQGATCNGKPISCGSQNRLADVIVALSFGKTHKGIDRMADLCRVLAKKARKLRSFGSAGFDLARVAADQFGGLLYRGIHIWDIAAGGIILKEAGGKLTAATQPDGTWNMVAAAKGVHDELIKIVSIRPGWDQKR